VTTPPLVEFSDATRLLVRNLRAWFPRGRVHSEEVAASLFAEYNRRGEGPSNYIVDVSVPVVAFPGDEDWLAFVPVALYERGHILASVAFAGTVAGVLEQQASEVLVLRNRPDRFRWTCLAPPGRPGERVPTEALGALLARVPAVRRYGAPALRGG
jgi:hypothetical protein